MARPIKNNADYFPHDADMRNDTRVKALRRKFGTEGYGIYCMLIELLTDSDYFQFKNDSLSIELVAGDFDIDPDKLTAILQYLNQLDLIQLDATTGLITCKSLDKRLEPLLSKRERDRDRVSASENTQSKVKESKVEQSTEKKSEEDSDSLSFLGVDLSVEKLLKDEYWVETINHLTKGRDLGGAARSSFAFLQTKPERFKQATLNDLKKVTLSWLENKKPTTPDLKAIREKEKNRLDGL